MFPQASAGPSFQLEMLSGKFQGTINVVLVDGARVEVEDLCDHADLGACAADRLADVLRFDPRELFRVFLDEGREATEQAGAVGRSHSAPFLEGNRRPSNGLIGFLDAGLVELGDRLLRCRVDHSEAHPVHLNMSSMPAATKARYAACAWAGRLPNRARSSPTASRSGATSSPAQAR